VSENPTPDEVIASIIAKSDQINAEDLIATGPITVTIKGVRRGSKEQPIQIDIMERDRPFRPCKTVRRTLIAMWGNDPKMWIGQRLTLYADPEVVYGGVRVGGLRVSHASGIDKPKTFLLTQTRGKKAEVTILPMPQTSPKDIAYIDDAKRQIANAPTMEVLNAIGQLLKEKSSAIQDSVRAFYKDRKAELETNEHPISD
jgi:hypothetical protein